MGWIPTHVRQYTCVSRFFVKLSSTQSSRLNKRIALWSFSKSHSCKNWFYYFQKIIEDLKIDMQLELLNPVSRKLIDTVHDAALESFKSKWSLQINSVVGPSGGGLNKLRTYCKFKKEFRTENYCQMILPLKHRSAFAKFRCGVAPLKIETGRYENIPLNQRNCPFCDKVETELHAMLECQLYDDLRQSLFLKAVEVDGDFTGLSIDEKFVFLFSNPFMIRACAKTCFNILQRRTFLLYK